MKKKKKPGVFDEVREFDERLKREHREFPRARIERLITMRPGLLRMLMALSVLPMLLRMAARTLASRWRTARDASPHGVVTVHASGPGGGFISGWYSDGRWWTHDFVDDGTTWGRHEKREIRVLSYRELEGSAVEPWHDDDRYYPPDFEDQPPRIEAKPTVRERRSERDMAHTDKRYHRAIQEGFIHWDPSDPPTIDEVAVWIAKYFTGLEVEMKRDDYRPGGRNGFSIHIRDFPLTKHYSCGEDPDSVEPRRQSILVQVGADHFHASPMESHGMTEALAVGLNVYVRDALKERQRELARAVQQTGGAT